MSTPEESTQPTAGSAEVPPSGETAPVARRKRKAGRKKAPRSGFWEFLKENYASVDPRSLGIFRIALGTLLFVDVARRWPDIEGFYANTGWLTNHFAMFRPMSSHLFSLYLAFGTPGEVKAFVCFHLLVCFLLIIGYRTRLMHVMAALLLVSINSRNIAIENGGWVVLILLTIWSCFLPLGARFSVDALLGSLRARKEGTEQALNDRSDPKPSRKPIVSLAVVALVLQWATIYYFNVVHKSGPQWRDGTAVYYFLQQDRMVTTFGAWLRDIIPLGGIKMMTYGALAVEATVAALMVQPFFPKNGRMVAWLLVASLHLSIDSMVQLGPFSYAMITVFFVFIPASYWDRISERLKARRPSSVVKFDPDSGFALFVCRLLKRLDAFKLLKFEESPDVDGIAVEQGGERASSAKALELATRSLPLPRLYGVPLRLPGVRRLLKRGFDDPEWADHYFDLGHLPGADVVAAPTSSVRVFFRRLRSYAGEATIAVIMVACVSQVLMENRAIPKWLKLESRPEWMEAIVIYPRMFQGWSMFAPSPPTDDGRIVVDGLTKDGRRLDPLTGTAPSFSVEPKGGYHMNQIWGDFTRRIHEDRFKAYWNGLRDFVKNHHEFDGRPEDELVAFDIYFVSENIAPPGAPRNKGQRRKLISFGDGSKLSPPKESAEP